MTIRRRTEEHNVSQLVEFNLLATCIVSSPPSVLAPVVLFDAILVD